MIKVFLGLTPFIFITLIGFFFGRSKILDLNHAKILNLFLFYIAVPALIINFVAQSEISQIDFNQIIVYFIMQIIIGSFTFFIVLKFFNRPISESIIWSLTVALSNHVTLLLPITKIYFENDVVTQVASIILLDGVILLSFVSFFLELVTKKCPYNECSNVAQIWKTICSKTSPSSSLRLLLFFSIHSTTS